MIYINGLSNISPQPTSIGKDFLSDVVQYNTNMLQCMEPNYSEFMNVNELRRMGRVLKLGSAGAKFCLEDASLDKPDAICIGTGKGCFKNTQVFLFSVDKNKEKFVPPSPFIQSAHSSIASQIAIQTGCKNYNMTYAHRTFSFESALLDAMMLLNEKKHTNVLLGGVDEIEEIQFNTFDRIGYYKKPGVSNLNLLADQTKGTIAGEGSAFFLLEDHPANTTYAAIIDVYTFSNHANHFKNKDVIEHFLIQNNLSIKDIDVVVLGLNGDIDFDGIYKDLNISLFKENRQVYYKHLCGDYLTSSAFALWLSSLMIYHQHIPEIVNLNDKPIEEIKNVLIYNQHRNVNHSLMLVSSHA
ncbi:MAG: beta-ketoacyl synthase N-terminal-like domain-containing protein [Bacteroidales bacterium]|jgi:3-oxoacyl-(acyl-carrier-protein) synthase|nr:beta-ketoacyl synthase N-terminal-like domain-containing protein [Bacteroidales bacterium]